MSEVTFVTAFAKLPLIAILRGVSTLEVESLGGALIEEGFELIEVPLTSPNPFASIEILARQFGDVAVIGAGTMRTEVQLDEMIDAGGRLMVTPHGDTALIAAAKRRGLATVPGVATPTEGFAALDAGADALKIFPADGVPPSTLRSWRTVFPTEVALCPSGGVAPERLAEYVAGGAGGFGIGTLLYKPGSTTSEVKERARAYVEAWRAIPAAAPRALAGGGNG